MPSAVSLRYARALVDAVTGPPGGAAPRDPRATAQQLREFQVLLEESAELRTLFATPAIAAAKKKPVMAELAATMGLDPLTKNFLNVVIDHDRMPQLKEILEAFEALLDQRLGIAEAEIRTSRPLEENEKQELAEALQTRTGKQVRMNFVLDPGLLGGIVARVGSIIYDGSVRGLLERLRTELVTR
ncbi:MAG: ATP synthase F1 subunit delta [Acidobacteria bacterium]|nr:ATP synthase F1 subunit delta [Acidobacteriota bacterium]